MPSALQEILGAFRGPSIEAPKLQKTRDFARPAETASETGIAPWNPKEKNRSFLVASTYSCPVPKATNTLS